MSDLEDFKLGGKHNAGDPDGARVAESPWKTLADRIEALGLPRPIRGEKVMPLFERVVTAFEKERAKYRFQYVGDLHGTPVHLHQDPPTSAEPVAWLSADVINRAEILASDMPHTVVEKLRAAATSVEPVAWQEKVTRLYDSLSLLQMSDEKRTEVDQLLSELHAHPPTSIEPDVMRLVDAYVLLHVDALDDHPIVLEARAAIIAALKTR